MADTPPAKDTPSGKGTSQSYVYPARSLLGGRIQPAADQSQTSATASTGLLHPAKTLSADTIQPSTQGFYRTNGRSNATNRRSTTAADVVISGTRSPNTTFARNSYRNSPSNARNTQNTNYSVEEYTPVEFSPHQSLHSQSLNQSAHSSADAAEPSSGRELYGGGDSLELSGDALPPVIKKRAPSLELPFNLSEYGLVHLLPLPKTASPTERSPTERPGEVQSMGALPGSSTTPANIREPSVDRSPDTSDLEQSSSPGSATEYYSGSSSRSESIVNVRFEHREDENGNHVIVGREGILQRCEDEPIRTPGSVQAFGVLIAVEEKDDALVVRQVSENSTEVLGLPPRFLFSLRCFTEILSDPQAELLWDKIQDLSDLENEEDDGVQVFSLTGWGAPGTACLESDNRCRPWTCWCAIHRPSTTNDASSPTSDLIIMEFECERDTLNPLYPPGFAEKPTAPPSSVSSLTSPGESVDSSFDREMLETKHDTSGASSATLGESTNNHGLEGDEGWTPSAADILESTTSHSKPLSALERLRRAKIPGVDEDRPNLVPSRKRSLRKRARIDDGNIGMMDVFAIMSQINEQLGSVESLDMFLKVVVGIVKDLSQFHRVMVYQFDEGWNGQVVAELVDWNQTQDLYQGLHFPASDIPAQARALYAINKVRLLYNRLQSTARIVVRSEKDLETPLNMTHCYLRAMSPIHIKYLGNMGVRASMSISIMAFDKLWGLITCHSYGTHGMRVSFPVRQMLRLLSQSISRNIERLSYAQRLHTRKVIHHIASNRQPAVYIVSNTEDLLGLFEADFGILVIGEGAKILGPNEHGQEILVMAEYLRLKQFDTILASQSITKDFSDLQVTAGFHTISGLLLVPLSMEGTDFIAFLRKGQPREVRWAGKPYKDGREATSTLEPRKSFKTWTEVVAGRSRVWSEEQLETAGVLALVYGKFIEVWRQKERALQTTKLTELLLSNASHEVRTPLNHIINYLEMALDGPLDNEARENLSRSHTASKSLLFTINDLLDLTRLETGKETYFNEPFNLPHIIETATHFYRKEAERRDIAFHLDLAQSPRMVVGDATKVRTVVENLTANSLQYTMKGSITVSCMPFSEPQGLRSPHPTAVDIVVADTGGGIPPAKLEHIFREFEQVECSEPPVAGASGVGLGLAVVARIVEQLGGRLRVDSKVDHGSRFSFLIPLVLSTGPVSPPISIISTGYGDAVARFAHPRRLSATIPGQAIDHVGVTVRCGSAAPTASPKPSSLLEEPLRVFQFRNGSEKSIEHPLLEAKNGIPPETLQSCPTYSHMSPATVVPTAEHPHLRILVVEDNDINRKILAKRLVLDGHTVVSTTNGQEGLDKVKCDRAFDAVLMDIQMPILNGFDSTRKIREFEKSSAQPPQPRLSHHLNGRIPIFAVSASLLERQCDELIGYGMDGWILKPIDFRRLGAILKGVTDRSQRQHHCYKKGCSWEGGGWLPE